MRFSRARESQAVHRLSGLRAPLQRRRLPTEVDYEATLTFRIGSISGEDETIIRLEGRLGSKGVNDLKKAIQEASGLVLLDLSGLQSADAEGVRELRSISAKGTKMVGASPYIRQLLDEEISLG